VRIRRICPIQRIDQLIDLRRLRWVTRTMLQLLPVIEEEASMMGAQGVAGDEIAASALRAAKVVPPARGGDRSSDGELRTTVLSCRNPVDQQVPLLL
jgi:hypothetical protein